MREVLHKHKKNPDGLIFEILVALSYAAKGWEVEMLEQQLPAKSPDMRVRKGDVEIYVECKRLDRRTSYAEQERNDFLWSSLREYLVKGRMRLCLNCKIKWQFNGFPDTWWRRARRRPKPWSAPTW